MQYFYGSENILRALDEAEFWKHQEKEHTVVIRKIVPNLESKYVNALEEWELAFSNTHSQIVKFIESVIRSNQVISPFIIGQIINIINSAGYQSQQFVDFLTTMKSESDAVRNNMVAKTVIDHIIRESEYFIGISQAVLKMPL